MTNFKNFELNNSEMIFGGERIPTSWTDSGSGAGGDVYDTTADRIVYF